ncbi:MAG: DUF4105 domain-containing protein [Gammaproteobacteria bacterium]|nr:MAG: DUF4105 domain-containing protein [Gammaproteobacteria bacterium]
MSVTAHAASPLLQSLLQRAEALQLHKHADWHNLLHYKSHVLGGVYSQADDARFFLAINGQRDAHAELMATLTAMVNDEDSRCRFPARLHWLDSQLHFMTQLSTTQCTEFELWRDKLNTQQITLVFPAMYLNNPASMFGHTFLRLDQPGKSGLLSYTLSYGAQADPQDNALQYVINGLTGGYKGVFSVQPYYETVQAYGDIEHRDIWEYTLNLTHTEVDQLIRHAWELRQIHFDYYFVHENCSYRLLSLLDVARPGSNLTHEQLSLYALPVDTVRLVEQADMIANSHYRPAITSRLKQMYEQLDSVQQETIRLLIQQEQIDWQSRLQAFDPQQQARMLDMASEWQQFTYKDEADRAHELLLARSRIYVAAEEVAFAFAADDPLDSHASARIYFAYGAHEQQGFVELALRPVFHDVLDEVRGFAQGAAIEVFNTHVRWYEDESRMQLQQLNILNLLSLVPVQPWSTPLSAKLSVNITRRLLTPELDSKFFAIETGIGYSAQLASVMMYALFDLSMDYSAKLDDNYGLYVGGEMGALFSFDHGRMLMAALLADSVSGLDNRKERYRWQYQFSLAQQHALSMQYETTLQFIRDSSWSVGYYYYF